MVLPLLLQATGSNSWVRIVDIALLYVLLALGLNIVVGYAGLLDLGYIAFLPSVRTCTACWPHPIWRTPSRPSRPCSLMVCMSTSGS